MPAGCAVFAGNVHSVKFSPQTKTMNLDKIVRKRLGKSGTDFAKRQIPNLEDTTRAPRRLFASVVITLVARCCTLEKWQTSDWGIFSRSYRTRE